jgi:hypothetical protein
VGDVVWWESGKRLSLETPCSATYRQLGRNGHRRVRNAKLRSGRPDDTNCVPIDRAANCRSCRRKAQTAFRSSVTANCNLVVGRHKLRSGRRKTQTAIWSLDDTNCVPVVGRHKLQSGRWTTQTAFRSSELPIVVPVVGDCTYCNLSVGMAIGRLVSQRVKL